MNKLSRTYLKTLTRELCKKVDGDEIVLDVFCEVLKYYKEKNLINAPHVEHHIEFIEKKRDFITSRQTVLACVGAVTPHLYKVKVKRK